MLYPMEQGCGVIAHDRRGHGRTAQMSDGHHMDRLAADVAEPVVNSTQKIYEKFPRHVRNACRCRRSGAAGIHPVLKRRSTESGAQKR
jgi:alpha-beta hydrolase superfamily lysophospholipase